MKMISKGTRWWIGRDAICELCGMEGIIEGNDEVFIYNGTNTAEATVPCPTCRSIIVVPKGTCGWVDISQDPNIVRV